MSKSVPTYLVPETAMMEQLRREEEKKGHHLSFLAKVHSREHALSEPAGDPGLEQISSMQQHPELDSPLYDGVDPDVNPAPALNTDARTKYDNERREQEMEKQLRLQNAPQFSPSPKPRPY